MTDLTQVTSAQIAEDIEMLLTGASQALGERCYRVENLQGVRLVMRLALNDLDQAGECLRELERRKRTRQRGEPLDAHPQEGL